MNKCIKCKKECEFIYSSIIFKNFPNNYYCEQCFEKVLSKKENQLKLEQEAFNHEVYQTD